jgi:hypothetical protein
MSPRTAKSGQRDNRGGGIIRLSRALAGRGRGLIAIFGGRRLCGVGLRGT